MRAPFVLLVLLLGVLIAGCGVNKDYVAHQIQESEGRTDTKIDKLRSDNDAEIARLEALAKELESKADMALNKAAGFENYQIIWTGEIRFAFDSYEISDEAAVILEECGAKMDANPRSVVEIAGHTDRTGQASYNMMLGQMRATSAQRFLNDRFGISLYRIFLVSHGEHKPVAMPDERNAGSLNRRVILTVWGEM